MKDINFILNEKEASNVLDTLEIAIANCREILTESKEKDHTYFHYDELTTELIKLYKRLATQLNLPKWIVTKFD